MSGTLTIRKVDDDIRQALKLRAHLNNRSMEEEARHILAAALSKEHAGGFGHRLAAIGRKYRVTEQEITRIDALRDRPPAVPMDVG